MEEKVQEPGVRQVITRRRTVKPDKMNGRPIDDEIIMDLLRLADWAPTHANTEPWRFVVFSGPAVKKFTQRHADLYRQYTAEASFTEQKFANLARLGEQVSHLIIVWMKRVPNHKIPEIEEVAATSAAIQNLLLAATAQNIVSFWSTGGMTHHAAMREELKLGAEDRVLGMLYLGYSDEPPRAGSRQVPLADKIEWIR